MSTGKNLDVAMMIEVSEREQLEHLCALENHACDEAEIGIVPLVPVNYSWNDENLSVGCNELHMVDRDGEDDIGALLVQEVEHEDEGCDDK